MFSAAWHGGVRRRRTGPVRAPAAHEAQPAAPDDPAKVAAAKQFIQLYHPNTDPKNVSAMIDSYLPRAIEAQRKEDPKFDAKKFAQERRAQIMANAAKGLDMQSHIVSRHFTLPELKELIAFYSSAARTQTDGGDAQDHDGHASDAARADA